MTDKDYEDTLDPLDLESWARWTAFEQDRRENFRYVGGEDHLKAITLQAARRRIELGTPTLYRARINPLAQQDEPFPAKLTL
jgi:hypothetical protein